MRRPVGGLLRTRNFALLWVGQSTSAVGSAISTVALPLVAVSTLHAGPAMVALLTAATWLPWLLIGLPVGVWVDRWPRRRTLLVADVASAAVLVAVPLATWAGVLSTTMLVVAALLAGAAGVFANVAFNAFLPSLVGAGDLMEGNARLQTSASVALVVGPGLGGLLAEAAGAVSGVLVDAVTFLVSAACLLGLRPGPEPRPLASDQPHASAGGQPRASVSDQPRASAGGQPSASVGDQSRAPGDDQPFLSVGGRLRASSNGRLRASVRGHLRASAGGLLRASVRGRLRASSGGRLRASSGGQPRASAGDRPGMLRQVAEGIGFILRGRLLQAMLVVAAVTNFAMLGITALRVVFLVRAEGTAPGTAGLVIGVGSLGAILGAALASPVSRRFGSARTYLAANVAAAPFVLLLPLGGHGWRLTLFAAGSFLALAGATMSNVMTMTFRGSFVPAHLLGRVTAASRIFVFGAIPFGAATAGLLASTLGIRPAMWVLAVLYVIAPLPLLATEARTLRDFPAQDAANAAR
ncbi:MFS transporter [Dactylosporangium sp. CA-139114]|uniref:MFS transporter n=1 Tax=Dactylosporangium sp. CA-139114 TaxID=3239931 RepID=UPI003D957EB7